MFRYNYKKLHNRAFAEVLIFMDYKWQNDKD